MSEGKGNQVEISPYAHVKKWEFIVAWTLKLLILIASIAELMLGDFILGVNGLLIFGVSLLPAIIANSTKVHIPIGLETIILVILANDVVLGKGFNLYDRLSYFDKGLHFWNSLIIVALGFLIVYALFFTGRLRISKSWIPFIIIFITLGIGAFWEILEYLADLVFDKGAQGSPTMSPHDDTMWDMIINFFGSVIGAVLGSLFIRHSKASQRWHLVKQFAVLGGQPPDLNEASEVEGERACDR